MAKLTKSDWKMFRQVLFITAFIVIFLGFVVMGIDNARLHNKLSTQFSEMIKHFETIIANLAITTSDQTSMLDKKVNKYVRNVNFLIHRVQILEEKVAKLEAHLETLECKQEKR